MNEVFLLSEIKTSVWGKWFGRIEIFFEKFLGWCHISDGRDVFYI